LKSALEERQKEIEIHKDILKAQIKNASEEKSSAKAELRERTNKIEKLKRKYEISITKFAAEEGDQTHSQAYYVIKAAQVREEYKDYYSEEKNCKEQEMI
jgi:UDP-glucose:O-linked fucose beta-1,3-glucosyltransferase